MSKTPVVDLYFSFRSPYSYIALAVLRRMPEARAIEWNVKVVYPLATRVPDFFKRADPLYRPYLVRDSKRMAEFHGVPFRRPNPDPIVQDPATAAVAAEQPYIYRLTRLGAEATRRRRAWPYVQEVSQLLWNGEVARWDEGAHLANAARRAGLDLAEMERAVETAPGPLDALCEKHAAEQRAAGHWGVPLLVHDGEPFFGHDRIPVLLWRLRQRGLLALANT